MIFFAFVVLCVIIFGWIYHRNGQYVMEYSPNALIFIGLGASVCFYLLGEGYAFVVAMAFWIIALILSKKQKYHPK